jgi:DNA-binding MarR family transcriptional regulator/tetratricopeptide (TPR) repeat protein
MGAQTYLPVEILDYIETHAPPEEAPYGISQRELAKALGYHPCSMSRPLATLTTDGLLDSRRGLVRDGQRRQLTYRITEQGRLRLKRETKEVPLLSGEIPPPPHPFLGRHDELEQLASFSRSGGAVTFVDGPPGMGKTALVSRHLRRIKRGRIPFWFTIRPASSPRQFVYALSHSLSFLGAPQLAYYAQLPRAPVAREVADLTARALAGRSLAAVIDDVQQAGTDMRGFLSEFTRALLRSAEHQFYFVSQEPPLFQSDSTNAHHLTIGGLDRAAAHDLTDRQGGLADRFESVYQSSLGSPLLLRLAVSNPGVEVDASTLPTVVVGRLSVEEVNGVLPVALANEPLPLTFVGESPHLSPGRLNELAKTGLLHRTGQGRVEMLQVVREALLRRANPPDERRAHSRLANFYARSHRPEAVRERFLHLVSAEEWRPAGQLLIQQERVILRLGYSETLRNSLRHLASVLPRGQSKVRVLMIEASLLRAHSDYNDALQSLRRAITEAAGEPKTTAECGLLAVELLLRMQQVDVAKHELETAKTIGPVTRRLHAFFELSEGRLEESSGAPFRAQSHYQEAFELARRTRNIDLELESIAAWSRVVELQSGHDVALKLISEALPEARQAGRLDIVLNLLLARARAYAMTGREELA